MLSFCRKFLTIHTLPVCCHTLNQSNLFICLLSFFLYKINKFTLHVPRENIHIKSFHIYSAIKNYFNSPITNIAYPQNARSWQARCVRKEEKKNVFPAYDPCTKRLVYGMYIRDRLTYQNNAAIINLSSFRVNLHQVP